MSGLTDGLIVFLMILMVSHTFIVWLFMRYVDKQAKNIFDINDKILALNEELIRQKLTDVFAMPKPISLSFAETNDEEGEEWKANLRERVKTASQLFNVESTIRIHVPTGKMLSFSPDKLLAEESQEAKCQWMYDLTKDVSCFYYESMVDAHEVFFRIKNKGLNFVKEDDNYLRTDEGVIFQIDDSNA